MNNTIRDVLQFVEENDVKFIRLAFVDIFGTHKNISIMPSELERAFAEGVPIDGSNVRGFSEVSNSDLILFPDPLTLNVLPWRPQQGRVVRFYCNLFSSDGKPYACDTRALLQKTLKRADALGYGVNVGMECEFYLFKTDENGNPTLNPFDNGGYMDVAPLDRGENVRREICLCLEEMGLNPVGSHHESGKGQNEIDIKYGEPLTAADNFLTFKSVVKNIAFKNGLYATFLPKPCKDDFGSGLHVNLSISKDGVNAFESEDGGLSETAQQFIAGILDKTEETTLILNPLKNSYERLGKFETPKRIVWGNCNRADQIRIPAGKGEKKRMELRNPDCSINPYLALSVLIEAGLDGIENKMTLCPEQKDGNCEKAKLIPCTFDEAVACYNRSGFVEKVLGKELADKYLKLKLSEKETDEFLNY